MAIDVSPGIAVQLDRTGTQAASQLQSAVTLATRRATTPSRSLPDDLGLSLSRRNGIDLPATDAGRAVSRSIARGGQIVADLRDLDAQLSLAINSGTVSSRTALRIDETRVSRLNINAEAGRTLTEIDRLVSLAETNRVNLISSKQGRVTIQTTEFGGRITVRPQPLDSAGLGLTDISALTSDQALEARGRVRVAIATAVRRIDSLGALQGNLQFRPGDAFSVVDFGRDTVFESTVRGRFVNLTA